MLRFVQVDAFTSKPFSGNPAVVFEPGPEIDSAVMQHIAREMNVSETAFLTPLDDGYRLRWFTPAAEVDLCGHATLAAAHSIWSEWGGVEDVIRFATLSGWLTARRDEGTIWLDFPAEPVTECAPPDELTSALGVEPSFIGMNRMDYLVEIGEEDEVKSLMPDFKSLKQIATRGVIVTAKAKPRSTDDKEAAPDFVSRFFAPAYGVDEDPVTGSAHCALAPYWGTKLGRTEMSGYQLSNRGGLVRVRIANERVHLGGSAVTVFSGQMV